MIITILLVVILLLIGYYEEKRKELKKNIKYLEVEVGYFKDKVVDLQWKNMNIKERVDIEKQVSEMGLFAMKSLLKLGYNVRKQNNIYKLIKKNEKNTIKKKKIERKLDK